MLKISPMHKNMENRLRELLDNLVYLQSLSEKQKIHSEPLEFVTPLSITPLMPVLAEKQLKYIHKSTYLSAIHFPKAIGDIHKLQKYQATYLPAVGLKISEDELQLDELGSYYTDLFKRTLGDKDPAFWEKIGPSTVALMLGEMIDNVREHSQAKNVYLFGQYWPKTEYVEFCLVDDGRGIFESLRSAGREVTDDMHALQSVITKYFSAKDRQGEERRGTGIKITRRLLVNNELRGEFMILSGKAAYIESTISSGSTPKSTYYPLTEYSFSGTIVAGRFRKPQHHFNYSQYVTN